VIEEAWAQDQRREKERAALTFSRDRGESSGDCRVNLRSAQRNQ